MSESESHDSYENALREAKHELRMHEMTDGEVGTHLTVRDFLVPNFHDRYDGFVGFGDTMPLMEEPE